MRVGRSAWLVAGAVAVGIAARLVYVLTSAHYAGGDQAWFVRAGAAVADGGLGQPYPCADVRPPGTALAVAALFRAFGDGNLAAIRALNVACAALTCVLVARLASRAAPSRAWAAPLAALFEALDPLTIDLSSRVMSENFALPIGVALLLAALDLADAPRPAAGLRFGGLAALLLLFRPDGVIECASLPVLALLWASARRRLSLRDAAAWGAAAVVALSVTATWRCVLAAREGPAARVFEEVNADVRDRHGFRTWMSNVLLPRRDWLEIVWEGPARVRPDRIPEDAYATPSERDAVRTLLAAAQIEGRVPADVDAEFARLGRARAGASPLRYFAVLPAARAYHVWLDPADSDNPRKYDAGYVPTAAGRAFTFATAAFRLALGAVFVACLALAWLRPRTAALLAAAVVLRTAAALVAAPLLVHRAAYEGRYVLPSHLVCVALLAAAIAALGPRLRDADYTPAGTPPT